MTTLKAVVTAMTLLATVIGDAGDDREEDEDRDVVTAMLLTADAR